MYLDLKVSRSITNISNSTIFDYFWLHFYQNHHLIPLLPYSLLIVLNVKQKENLIHIFIPLMFSQSLLPSN